MPDIRPTLDQIDAVLGDHEAGGVLNDDVSDDAMRWTIDRAAAPTKGRLLNGAEFIFGCSRAQAIADGELVDVSEMAREAGLRFPTALTRDVWADCVAWTDEHTQRRGWPQDQDGRLWDVLHMTRAAIRRAPSGPADRLRVQLYRAPPRGRGLGPQLVGLVAVCGPGDDAEPVITIMQTWED